MKNTFRYVTGAAFFAAAVACSPLASAQVATTVAESTTSDGTISEFSPEGNSIVIHSSSGTEPLRYSYSKSTTIVDDAGNPVDVSVVRSGVPVQVYYAREGDGMVARKIIVRRHVATEGVPAAVSEHKETTTTTTSSEGEHEHHHHDKD